MKYTEIMEKYPDIPNLPGYVSIKEAAKILGLADKTVYEYVVEGRLPAVRAVNTLLIATKDVYSFQRNIPGRPRKTNPMWRISPPENYLITTIIQVKVREGKQEAVQPKLNLLKQNQQHIFPGTVARYIIGSDTNENQFQIILIWRTSVMPEKDAREEALEEFRQASSDIFDWTSAQYDAGKVFLHA